LILARPSFVREATRNGCWNAAMNVTAKQFLKDFAFTCAAALATGGVVSLVAVMVILLFARG
jgi:hypothetical protein